MPEEISIGSVSADVVPSAKGFSEKLKAQLRDLRVSVKVVLDNAVAEELAKTRAEQEANPIDVPVRAKKLDELAAKVKSEAAAIAKASAIELPLTADGERLRRDIAAQVALIDALTKVEIPVDLEDAAKLRTKMAVELDVLRAMAREAHPTVTVDVDAGKAEAEIAALDGAARSASGGFSGLTTTALLLGPALIPVAAAAAGLLAALTAPLVAAGGGLTLFALISGKAVSDTEKQNKAITKLQDKVISAQNALDRASTPAGKKSAAARLAQDTAAYHKALADLSPMQRKFLAAQGDVKASFDRLTRSAGPAIFGTLASGMDLLAKVLPHLAPVLKAVADPIQKIIDSADRAVKNGTLDKFIRPFAQLASSSIATFASILGNIARGFVGIGMAFAPLSGPLLSNLDKWSASFAAIGSSHGLHAFVDYVHREGPVVASTLGSIGRAVAHIVTALAPLGHLALVGVGKLADGISKIPTPVLTVAAAAFVSIAASMKAISLAKSGLAALSTAASFGGLLRGGGAGGALGKLAAKGSPVPVFVTNPGFGGKPGGVGGAPKVPALLAASPYLLPLLTSGDSAKGQDTAGMTPKQVKTHQSQAAAIAGLYKSLGANSFGFNGSKGADDLLSAVLGRNPQLGLSMLKQAASVAGETLPKYVKDLGAAFPKSKAAVDAYNTSIKSQADLTKLLLVPALRGGLKAFNALPKAVVTRISTPGAVTSMADITRLARRYDLTPKQVRTVVALTGVQPALDSVARLQQQLAGLHNKTVTVTLAINAASHAAAVHAQIAGARASGGPVTIGRTYLVGERGPELFTPGASGSITPNGGRPPGGLNGIELEQALYRATSRAFVAHQAVVMSKGGLEALDLMVGTA